MASTLRTLHERSAITTEAALDYARRLFLTPTRVELAVSALRGLTPQDTVVAVVPAYVRSVLDLLE
jgi:hypothetical protein